jgi:hypothetical protein
MGAMIAPQGDDGDPDRLGHNHPRLTFRKRQGDHHQAAVESNDAHTLQSRDACVPAGRKHVTREAELQSQSLPLGERLEDYRITAVLGQGGFGITYRAVDENLRRAVAIKEYLPRQFAFRDGSGRVQPRSDGDEELFRWGLTRFVDEARALAMFRHPNIASVNRYFEANGTAYLVMEFEEGKDFQQWLTEHGRPDEDRLLKGILIPVLEGLAKVHDKGLLHRDIKPDNIFIRRDGTPVLIDFGASRPHGAEAATKLTSIVSAGYSPFEQYGSGERQGPWSDLYALAGTMYRAISGKPPADAIQRHQGVPLIPAVQVGNGHYSRRLLAAIDRALSLEIAARPQSAREFLSLLGAQAPAPAEAGDDVTYVRRGGVGGSSRAASTRQNALLLVAAVAVSAALAVAAAYLLTDIGAEALPTTVTAGDRDEPPGAAAQPDPEPAAGVAREDPGASSEATASTARAQPIDSTSETPELPPGPGPGPVDMLSEDLIWSGLDVSSSIRGYRSEQLAGALLAYTSIKTRFDACRDAGCSDLPALVLELRETMGPQTWRRGDAQGSIAIESPRRLDSDDCPFMLDVREQIDVSTVVREQVRTYCTRNGFDRVVQQASDVT